MHIVCLVYNTGLGRHERVGRGNCSEKGTLKLSPCRCRISEDVAALWRGTREEQRHVCRYAPALVLEEHGAAISAPRQVCRLHLPLIAALRTLDAAAL